MISQNLLKSIFLAISLSAIELAVAQQVSGEKFSDNEDVNSQKDARSNTADVITVTAQRREENVRDVPLSIIPISSDELKERNIESALELGRVVPNFYATRGAAAANTRFVIRGIGSAGNTAADPSTAFFFDGIYISRPSILLSSFLDIASVEVVRGPQGTLFGRNATVGAVSIKSKKPKDVLEADGYVELGNFGRRKIQAVVNVPVSKTVSLRLAAQDSEFDGYGEVITKGFDFGFEETTSFRTSVDFDFSPAIDWTVRFDYASIDGDGRSAAEAVGDTLTASGEAALAAVVGGASNLPELEDPFDFRVNHTVGGDLRDEQWGMSSDFSYSFESGYTLSLISGFRDYENRQTDDDILFLAVPFVGRTGRVESETFTNELRLVSPDRMFGGRFNFVAGLYALYEDALFTETLALAPRACLGFAPAPLRQPCLDAPRDEATDLQLSQESDSLAVYGQAEYALTETLTLQFGARFTSDERDGRFVQQAANPFAGLAFRAPANTDLSFSDESPTGRLALTQSYDNSLFFASYSTGYKAGGFNSGGASSVLTAETRTFESETANNIEVGYKGLLFGDYLDLSITLYRMELEDFQARSFDGTNFFIRNAGTLTHQGVESEFDIRIADGLSLAGGIAYLDSEFDSFKNAVAFPGCTEASPAIDGCGPIGGNRSVQDLSGGRNHFAPEWTGNLFLNFEKTLKQWRLRGNVGFNYIGDQFVGVTIDNNPQVLQDGYALLSTRFSVMHPSDRYSVSIFGENLTDKGYCGSSFYQPLGAALRVTDPMTGGSLVRCNTGAPRTYGLRLSAYF